MRRILTTYRTWAVVGSSPDPRKPAHFVPAFLQQRGYRIVPVNPEHAGEEILGERCYATLLDVPESIGVEVVDLFRRAHLVPPHVDEAVKIGARAIWMQAGIVNDEAARVARDAGLDVVMDACPKTEIPMLGSSFRAPGAAA